MAPLVPAFQANGATRNTEQARTLDGLQWWSCTKTELPSVDRVRHLHVYDFDNTLFVTPLPNRRLWQMNGVGALMGEDMFTNGGWWHDPNVLALTGEGVEKEEPKGWAGWWNEQIVELVRLSMQQQDALTVLLTGRAEKGFGDLIQKMAKSRQLEFDLIVLKPKSGPSNEKLGSTMKYKQAFLEYMIKTYHVADEIRIYEDRVKHVKDFRDFLAIFNSSLQPGSRSVTNSSRTKPIKGEVIEVVTNEKTLDPLEECAQVQRMVSDHNETVRNNGSKNHRIWSIQRTVYYTGYQIQPADTARLLAAAKLPASSLPDGSLRTLANNVLITPRPAPKDVLAKAGGMGAKLRWRVIAIGTMGTGMDQVWAARVEPVPLTAPFYVEAAVPSVVLALRRYARPADGQKITDWAFLPLEERFEFDSKVGEKVLLKLEEDHAPRNNNGKRSRGNFENDFPALQKSAQQHGGDRRISGPGGQNHGRGNYGSGGARGGRGGNRAGRGQSSRGGGGGGGQRNGGGGGGGGGGGSSRRGGHGNYRSLDDEASARGARSFGHDGAADDYVGLSY